MQVARPRHVEDVEGRVCFDNVSDESTGVVFERGGLQGVQTPLHLDLALHLSELESMSSWSGSSNGSYDSGDRTVSPTIPQSIRSDGSVAEFPCLDWPAPVSRVCYICGQLYFLEWSIFGDSDQLELGERNMCPDCGLAQVQSYFDSVIHFDSPEHNMISDGPQVRSFSPEDVEVYVWSDSEDEAS